MATFFITGASRGLGLAIVRELASFPASEVSKVIASARGDAPALDELAQTSSGRVVTIKLDVTDQASIKKAAAEVETKLEGKGLDVLINNAGVMLYASAGVKSMSAFLCPNIPSSGRPAAPFLEPIKSFPASMSEI
jgi:NAD(P)-dependent dehydrogenase (short-subunit alcohol dehydrogenase family)